MLRTRSALPHSVVRWTGQVAASIGATLVASLLYSALPRPAPPEAARPELTSGGKFAARAVEPAALDGLDVMPLPHVAPRPVQAAVLSAEVPPAIRRVAFDAAAPLVLAPERPARAARLARAPARTEPRRAGAPAPAPAPQAVITAAAPHEATTAGEGGFVQALLPEALQGTWPAVLPRVVSTARAAWTMTASAGGSLVDRVVPQMP